MSTVATAPNPTPATRLMTADDFFDFVSLPENENRSFELVRGKVVEMSRPTKQHGLAVTNIALELKLYARQKRIGYVTVEAGVQLEEDTVRGPDVAYFTDATTFDDIHPKWGGMPPILAVEVLSPNDRPGIINAKIRDYLDNGVKIVWVIDCEDRTVIIHRQNVPFVILKESQELTGGGELPGFSCPIRNLFLTDGEQPS